MFDPKTTLAYAALAACCLLANAGCHDAKPAAAPPKFDSSMPDTTGMSKEDLMAQGKAMIDRGQSVKDNAQSMKPGNTNDGLTPDELMMKGDEMMKNGKAMMDMGMAK